MNTQLLESEDIGFAENNSLHMSQRTYQWLMNAVSLPEANNKERRYYDYVQNELFVIYEGDSVLLNNSSNSLSTEGYTPVILTELADRLLKISQGNDITEISRMPLDARKAIQLEFIAGIDNFKFFDSFSFAIHQQDHSAEFVLDRLLVLTKGAFYFIDYWAEFKTKQLLYFINEVEDNHNVNLQNASIWKRPESKELISNDNKSMIQEFSQYTKRPWWKFFN